MSGPLTLNGAIVSIAIGATVGVLLISLWLTGGAIVHIGSRWSRIRRRRQQVRDMLKSDRR